MKINKISTDAAFFAYDGCHKIYIVEDNDDIANAESAGYMIIPMDEIADTFKHSCPLRFISNWKLTKRFVEQGKKATFTSKPITI